MSERRKPFVAWMSKTAVYDYAGNRTATSWPCWEHERNEYAEVPVIVTPLETGDGNNILAVPDQRGDS